MVTLGDLTLWLSGPRTSARRPMRDGREPESGGWNRIVVEVEDLESTVERLGRAGVQFRNDIVSGVGGTQVLMEDPDGNPPSSCSRRTRTVQRKGPRRPGQKRSRKPKVGIRGNPCAATSKSRGVSESGS